MIQCLASNVLETGADLRRRVAARAVRQVGNHQGTGNTSMKTRSLLAIGLLAITVLSACDSGATATPSTGTGPGQLIPRLQSQQQATQVVLLIRRQQPVLQPELHPPKRRCPANPVSGRVHGGPATITRRQRCLNGAGATFPLPFISKWASDYNKLYSGVKVNYQGIGSGGGQKAIPIKR